MYICRLALKHFQYVGEDKITSYRLSDLGFIVRIEEKLDIWLTDWLANWRTYWRTGVMSNWLIDWQTFWLTEWLTDVIFNSLPIQCVVVES